MQQEKTLFGLQDRHQEVHVGQVQPDGSVLYEVDVPVVQDKVNNTIRFRGDFVHGTPQAPFLYLSLKHNDGEQSSWIRRLKIPLPELIWDTPDTNMTPVSLIGRIAGTSSGTVPLLDGGWKLEHRGIKESTMNTRTATPDDATAIAAIYNQGIEDRIATFETRLRTSEDIQSWFDGVHPTIVVENEQGIIAFASTSSYRSRECYAGIAECSVYVKREMRRHGAGKIAAEAIIQAAEEAGFWKLVSRVFVDNTASRALLQTIHFREVGIYHKHAKLDGIWRDVVIVERLLPKNIV